MTMDAELVAKPAKDVRRETIVTIAHEEFLANGYAGTSMSSIAARVGGSKATLYNYFPSKEDLFTAVVQRKCEEVQRAIYEAEVEGGFDVRTALTKFGERFLDAILNDQSIATYRLVTAESGRFPEVGRALYINGVHEGRRRLGDYLERARKAGQFRDGHDVYVAAEQFFELCKSGIHHRTLWSIEAPTPELIRLNVANAVSTFMRAYGV